MNRTFKDATIKRYHYVNHDELRYHLPLFVEVYDWGRRLKTLRGLTPTNSSAKPGRNSPNASGSIRHTTCRDRTSLGLCYFIVHERPNVAPLVEWLRHTGSDVTASANHLALPKLLEPTAGASIGQLSCASILLLSSDDKAFHQ